MTDKPRPRFLGSHEIREILGVSRQRAYAITRDPKFPVPTAELANGKVWAYDDVKTWMQQHRPKLVDAMI